MESLAQNSLFAESEFTNQGHEGSITALVLVPNKHSQSNRDGTEPNPSYFGEGSFQESTELIDIPDNIARSDIIEFIVRMNKISRIAPQNYNSSSIERLDRSTTAGHAATGSSLLGRCASSLSFSGDNVASSSSSIARRRGTVGVGAPDASLSGSHESADGDPSNIAVESHVFVDEVRFLTLYRSK
jgi:hypothetical protein